MSIIKLQVSKNANYIFHMMSVSKCGYDNSYGNHYGGYHLKKDLKTLKTNEKLLTVVGGKHVGVLYSVLVSTPATLDNDGIFINYLHGIKDLFFNGDITENYEKYKDVYQTAYSAHRFEVTLESTIRFYNQLKDLKTNIVNICDVLINNYSTYVNEVWINRIDDIKFKETQISKTQLLSIEEKWEDILSYKYPHDDFLVVLCNSISGGVQAIDIGYNIDVFDSEMNVSNLVQYISHEYGIFVLRDKLQKETDIDFYTNYDVIETIIEYFNPFNDHNLSFSSSKKQISDFIQTVISKTPFISVVVLIREVIKLCQNR